MPKISPDDIQFDDIKEFIEKESNFAFELRVLDKLCALSFICEHGGTYEDPVSKKIRQFDILARKRDGKFNITLSVECKNLKKNFPLLVHCTQRTPVESYHEIVVIKHSQNQSREMDFSNLAEPRRLRSSKSIYKTSLPVGRGTDQIYRDNQNVLSSNDSGAFEKISQAINSSYKLVQEANKKERVESVFICPVLVIPDETLWSVNYDSTELHNWQIEPINHVSLYIGKEWETSELLPIQRLRYKLSHLEIITIGSLEQVVAEFLGLNAVFNLDHKHFA
jgi:hypothetical protein